MAINPKDFMSTQTGGEGSTIQAEIETATPEQFKANISPVQQAEQTVEAPAIPQVPSVSESIVETPVEQIQQPVIVSEEDKIYSDLGLLKSEVDIPEQLNAIESRVIEDEITQPEETAIDVARYTEDGDRIMSASDLYSDIKNTEEVDSFVDESLFNDAQEAEEISLNYKTEDGLSIYSPSAEAKKQTKTIQSEYSNLGINVDGSGRVEVKKPSDNIYPKYKLPDTGVSYEKRPDGWYKDDGKGNYIKLKTDVERRSAYLDKNAVPVSEFGIGTKNTQNASKIINERVGPLRSSNTDNILTSGGDPTISDGLSFNQLTRSNIGKSSEKYNQDGTLNFNYDSKYENVPREVRPLLEYSGKPDGIYVYPGNDASYKKENGNWYKKPKGSSEYIQLKGEGVDQRISNLEMKAVASFKVKDASALINNKALLGSTKNLTQEYDNLNKVLFSGDGGKIGRYEESFEDAKNFANKDINLLLKDDMTLEQRQGLMDYQKRLNDIVSDGEYSLDKAIKTSQILKEAEQFFATSKDINKSINEAAQAGVSMARMSFENKKKTFQNTFLSGIAVEEITGSEFQKDAFDMFVATGSMADFFIENTDNGKIRFDSKSGQYVISKDISEIERKYIDEKLGQFVNQYNELQNKKFAETNEKVSKYKRSLSNINSNISKIEESLQGMRNAGMKVDDPAYVALSSQLDKERKKAEYLTGTINEAEKVKSAAFLTEPKKTAKDAASNLSQDAKNIFKAIPASVPPKQRFDLFYENLQKETTKFKKDNGIDESRLSGMNMAFKDLLDWDGFYALTEAEKRYAQNVATLRQLAPLYYNNDFGITQESAGFWESFVNSFYQSLFPNIAKAKGFDVQTSAAGKIIEVAAEEGYSEEDFIDSDALDKLRDRAVVDFNTMEKWGGMLGTTAGIIVPLMATRKLPSTALRVASNVERVIIGAKATADASKTVGIIANAEKVYDAVLSSNKIGRFLRPAIESGVRFEVAGTVFNQEELNFLSGLAGGVASEALSGVLSKIPKEQVYGYLSSVFGSQTSRAVNVIKATADASARGIAETGEEFAQEMTNIYKETDSFKGMMTELSNRFGTFDQVQEFVISSFILGAAFGVVDGKQGKDVLAKMPEEKRNQVNQALAEVNSSLLQADNAVDEYVENKLTQEAINKSVEEYDKKDEQGVSGQVGEGEKPVEGQPDVEAGQEAPSPSGMVQEEQVTPTEEKVTAMSADEAKNLWDQGYRPVIDGQQPRGGKDMTIDNLFNTKKQVEMVRTVTPEATTQAETIDVYHGGSMDEKTGDIYVTEDKGQATEYAKGNDGNVIKYSIPKDKVASEEEVANAISELGIDTNEEAKLFELIDPRFEETYIGDENKQKLFDSLKDKGFEAASFIDEDLTLREKGGVRNIVVFEAERLSPSSVTVTENQAENLYDQGYRPVIDGETQADYNKENIGDLFEQSERIEMALPTQAETQAEAETEQKGFEKLAEKIRSGKIDTRGGNMISIVPPQVLNAALEGVALTVETVGQVIEKIKESDWYKNLQDISKPIIDREIARSLNNLASKPVYTQQDAENEAYMTEFKEIYDDLLYQVERNPSIANVNNLKAFTENPKQFIQDLVDTGEIKSGAYQVSYLAGEEGKTIDQYVSEKMSNADSVISSDSKTTANNIIARQHDVNWRNTDAPFIMSESVYITSNQEKAKADGVTDEQIKEAEEYLANPIKYHQEIYDLYSDNTKPYYNEEKAQKALRELNYVKSVYERYGVDTGLTPEQSQQIDQEVEQLPTAPETKKPSRSRLTPEEKQAREKERKAERERVKAERESKKKADKEFGKKVAEVTGTAKPQKTVQRTASQALKDSIRDREKGWKMGQKNLQDIKEQVRDYAKENLPKDDYSKKEVEAIMNSITNAKTPKGLEKALDRVDAMVDKKAEAKRKRTIKDIQKKVSDKRTIFSKRGNKWVGKVSVDSQKEFFDFINSPALSNLDTKTQEELDAINDVIDGILSEGKADYSAVQRLEAKAKRQRAAKLIEGLAKGKQKELKGIDAVRDWLDKGNVVIINGEMFRKSDLKSLEFNQATAKRKRVALEKKLEKLKPTDYNAEFEIQSATQEMIELDLEIKNLEEQISEARDTERALSEAGVSPDATFVGYQQEVLSEQRSAQSAKKSKLRGLNPINAVNDIYSLLKSAYSGSSAVTKFIKENIERPIKKAYFEKMKGYQAKISEYYNNLEDIFGSKKKGLNYLSSLSSVNPTTSVLSSKEDLPVTNGHMVDWYNLIRTNENGDKRMESGNKDPKAIISYVESDPKLKAYADYLLNEYNGNLRLEYEPVYQSYTNTPFGDTTYYPSYAAGFEDSFVSEDDLMSDSPKFNMMNATARNLKQRTNYSGPFDTRLDAHAKFFDYVKTMEHAKHFMPIAKSSNELFSKMNNAYLIDNMGVDNFADLKEHLGVILSDAPLKGGGGFSNALSGFRSFSVVATLGGKLASIPKQFSSFTHYWTAGIELGVNPIEVMFAVPKNREELEFAAFIITSPYVKERYTGDSIDLEVRALADKALKSNTEDAWEALSKGFLWPVRFGDRTSVSTGGGQFALAVYRQAKIDGMSESEARDYAYEQFVTQSEATQQSTRSDFTSLIQRDPTFRTIAMYRTGQMANAKKVVNGVKTIYQAYNIEKSEGTDSRAEAISDDEIVQSIVDIMYYSTVGSWLFNAIASGALYYLWASETDDDDRDRMLYNLAMEQVSSNLQGYGATGYIAEFFFNALRGDEWKNNVPVLRTIENLSSVPPSFISAMLREWPNMTTAQRKQWLIDNKMPFEIEGSGSDVELEKFMEAFGDYPAWYKMNDSEKEQIIKNIGGGNINTLIKNTGKFIEGEGDLIKVLMNYEDQYMQKEKELGKKDLLWELITGEPYVKKDKNEKIKTDLIFPEAIKKENLQESLMPKLD